MTGAASGCGRYCALMLKQCPLIDELALHDDKGCGLPAVALDLSHIDTRTTITAYEGPAKLKAAVKVTIHILNFYNSVLFGPLLEY